MPEYRQDPVSGSWVIVARERSERPTEFAIQSTHRRIERCPFCRGNEHLTPHAVATYPQPADGGRFTSWQVRVIANKYPAVVNLHGAAALGPAPPETGVLFARHPGHGVHEVIVESPEHATSFSELTPEQANWSFMAYRDRLLALADRPGIRHGLVFKNCRAAGGATLEHTHSQLLATALVPPVVGRELRAAEMHTRGHGDCLFCQLLSAELAEGCRVVATTERFVAFCPFASRFPYETWVLPRHHAGRYELAGREELEEISRVFQRILRSLEKILPQAPHNYWIHSAPFDTFPYDYYHWHLELISRTTTHAGFEWGSGCFVNPVAPEDAAAALRNGLE